VRAHLSLKDGPEASKSLRRELREDSQETRSKHFLCLPLYRGGCPEKGSARRSPKRSRREAPVQDLAVRKSGRRDLIRLLKLWKVRRGVPLPSFVLEVLGLEGAKSTPPLLEPQLGAALAYIRDHVSDRSIADPANSNNNLADTMTPLEKATTRGAAAAAVNARTWNEVFG